MLKFAACALLLSTSAFAQQTSKPDPYAAYQPKRQTVVYEAGQLLVEDSGWGWYEGDALRRYAAAHSSLHGGNFVLFCEKDGTVRDLNDAAAVQHLQDIYAPMRALNAQQHALSAPQHDLGTAQHALGSEMKAASTPEEMGRIGQQMGAVGSAQGQIGRTQGAVGREQGIIGEQLHAQLNADIDHCLSARSCPVIEQTAASARN